MKNLLERLSKLKHPQFVIPAQAGIQAGDMPSLVSSNAYRKNISFAGLSLKVGLRKLQVDWIPACAGMTVLAKQRRRCET